MLFETRERLLLLLLTKFKLGYSSIGIEKIEKISKSKGRTYFEKINKSGKRLLKLLEDLIDAQEKTALAQF
jgi:hypothetical protein